MRDLKRDIYRNLLEWKKNNSGKVLEIEGARQVGKTYIISKFAKENYKTYLYINMVQTSGKEFLQCLDVAEKWEPGEERVEKPIHRALELFDKKFTDTEETVIFIDEIQESARVFSLLREFARDFRAHFIVTGSYLGKVFEKEYFLPAGDLDTMTLNTLSFEEFLEAAGKRALYNELDLYGDSKPEEYEEIKSLYQIYCQIGGYPAVVKTYFETESVQKARKEVGEIIRIFVYESERYFDDILEMNLLEQLLPAIAQLMLKEKKGSSDLIKELSKIVFNEDTNRITKKSINQAIAWFYRSHIIGYCGKVNEGDILNVTPNCRFYFCDVGVAAYFLNMSGARPSDIDGMINENFVYLYLKKESEIMTVAGNTPLFATYKNGELDFFVNSRINFANYAVEVKTGKNQGKTAAQMLKDGKVSYIYYLKGDTYGGSVGRIITIPIYLTGKIKFDLKPKEFYMLDSTAYNHIAASQDFIDTVKKSIALGFVYCSTAVQDIELSGQGAKTYDPNCLSVRKNEMPKELLEKFAMLDRELHINRLPEVAIAMRDHARVDGTNRFLSPDSPAGQAFRAVSDKNKVNSSRPYAHTYDAVIAEAAMHYGCILVTDDVELRNDVNASFKNRAISTETLICNINKALKKDV